MSELDRPVIAYIVSRYPQIAHSHIQREIIGLREAGYDVVTLSVARSDTHQVLSPLDRQEAERTLFIRPAGPFKLLRHLLLPALRHPGALFGSLRVAARGWWTDPRALVWRIIYLAEALMVWSMLQHRGVSHIHAHHANVASNIAWLTSDLARRIDKGGPSTWSFTMHGSTEFFDVDRHDLGAKAEAAAGVACISDFTRSQLMMLSDDDTWGAFHVVHCGVDLTQYSPISEHLRGPDQPFTVLYVGRLGSEKGIPILVEAMEELRQRAAPRRVRLIVVGEGDYDRYLEARGAEIDLDIEMVGAVGQHEIVALYHGADALCLTSFREGLPVVLMEAMACEVPCVAPAIAGIPEIIVNGETGLTFTAGRSDQVADALERIMSDPILARELGRAGRETVIENFSLKSTIAGMVEFFDRIFDRSEEDRREPAPL